MSTNHVSENDDLFSTADVAHEADAPETWARDWAAENGVQRVGNAFVWTAEDVDDFIADLDEDDEYDGDDEGDDECDGEEDDDDDADD
jgi:hypothetical protein